MAKAPGYPEDRARADLRRLLPEWLHIREEVWEREHRSRIDFICYPKPSLLALGWEPKPFGIEVKGYDLEDKRKRTAIHAVYQAIQYATATFIGQSGQAVKLDTVLLYPRIGILLGQSDQSSGPNEFSAGVEHGLTRLAALFRVGELLTLGRDFEVRFNGARYFDTRGGMARSKPLAGPTTRANR